MEKNTVLVFTRYGLGEANDELQTILAGKFLTLLSDSNLLPAKMLFYTNGVKLACQGSPILGQLKTFQGKGVELILCKTCLDYFAITNQVEVGIVSGMPDIIDAMAKAEKVISL